MMRALDRGVVDAVWETIEPMILCRSMIIR